MFILSGFITALGVVAVAVAFVALNAATFGIAGVVVATVGAGAMLAGVGLFAKTANGANGVEANEIPENDQQSGLTPL